MENRFKINEQTKQQVQEIIGHLSLEEKVHILTGELGPEELEAMSEMNRVYNPTPWCAGGVERLQVPSMKFSDGPRGVVMYQSTCFPVSMARAASFDRELEHRIGQVIGTEVRAGGGNYFGGVCINLLRHPAWGRAQECYGEDPYLQGEMGLALTRGVQEQNVIACLKHFALNSMENMRFKVNVKVDDRALHEVYLPHFKKCIDGGAASVMGAYNKVNGDYACENERLLREILMQEWGFEGFVISDFVWAIHDTVKAANAGCHVEMPFPQKYGEVLKTAVEAGQVSTENIDDAVSRIISTLIQFSGQPESRHYSKTDVACQAHMDLARETAEKSMVLLKNDGNVLPISPSAKQILVVGKLADTENTGDHGSSQVHPPYVVTALQGLRNFPGEKPEIVYDEGTDLAHAAGLARQADYVIAVCGYTFDDEGEYISPEQAPESAGDQLARGGDRRNLSLGADDIELLNAVGKANQNTIAVIIAGSAVIMEEWRQNVSAILFSFYCGSEGGNALANLLFGKVNPSGKLPFTIARNPEDYPFLDIDAEEITYDLFHGYSHFDKNGCEPVYAFGYGLSYTEFSYSELAVKEEAEALAVSVKVENTGNRPGEEVVQVYIGARESRVERQHKLLAGYKKYQIAPGQEITATIMVDKQQLSYYEPSMKTWVLEDCMYEVYAGSSSRERDLLSTRCDFSVT
ncbi:MAG: glycosyl hydrolase [Proteobacteria bacterium]|nr:glycosyl hydrolase [Pseudomonadota bacterium]